MGHGGSLSVGVISVGVGTGGRVSGGRVSDGDSDGDGGFGAVVTVLIGAAEVDTGGETGDDGTGCAEAAEDGRKGWAG